MGHARGTQCVGKAAAVLRVLGQQGPAGVSEIARRTAMPKSTVYRLVARLEDEELVHRDGPRYTVAAVPNPEEVSAETLRDAALPYLTEFHVVTSLPVGLGALVNGQMVVLQKVYVPSQRGHVRDAAALEDPEKGVVETLLTSYRYLTSDFPESASREAALAVVRRGAALRTTPEGAVVAAVPVLESPRRALAAVGALLPSSRLRELEHFERNLRICATRIAQHLASRTDLQPNLVL